MSYALRNDGAGWRAVDGPDQCGTDETWQDVEPVLQATTAELIRMQIVDLELQQTPRRMREAALGTDGGWLANLDAQIQALRKKLA